MRRRVFVQNKSGGFEQNIHDDKNLKPALINIYDVKTRSLHLGSESEDGKNLIGCNFGRADLYADSNSIDVDYIEKEFSKQESAAARIVATIAGATSQKDTNSLTPTLLTLKRRDVNLLRKFLFLLGFRSERHATQFSKDIFDKGTQACIDAYKAQHNLCSSRDVWLTSLREILDTKPWEIPSNERILEVHRIDYFNEMRGRTLVFWQAPEDSEFILSSNGFGVWEGVPGEVTPELMSRIDHMHKRAGITSELEIDRPPNFFWVILYPVTPKAVMVLGSILLVKAPLLAAAGAASIPWGREGFMAPSRFKDFPFPIPLPTYKDLSRKCAEAARNGKIDDFWTGVDDPLYWGGKLDGRVLESRVKDEFTFTLARISKEQVQMVNSYILENCQQAIAFRSLPSLYKSIKAFESDPILLRDIDYTSLKRQIQSSQYRVADNGERAVVLVPPSSTNIASNAAGATITPRDLYDLWQLLRKSGSNRVDLRMDAKLAMLLLLFNRTHNDRVQRDEEAEGVRLTFNPAQSKTERTGPKWTNGSKSWADEERVDGVYANVNDEPAPEPGSFHRESRKENNLEEEEGRALFTSRDDRKRRSRRRNRS
jgi:hypothetical protein